MTDVDKQLGVIQATLEQFNKHELPRMLALLERVNRGETLSDLDLSFLQEVAEDSNRHRTAADHPELTELFSRAVDLFSEITEKALANEKAGEKP